MCAANNEKPSYNGCPYRYDIDKATLFIRRKLIASKIIDEHRKLLAAGNTLKYPMNECEITTYTISKGMISNITDSVLSGRIPKIIVIGFVSSAAFNGELSHSAFNFSSYNMSEISLAVNVQSMEYKTIPFDFKEGDFLQGLETLAKTAGIPALGNGINRDNYTKGNCLVAFEIFPIIGNSFSVNKIGQIRLAVRFKETLPENINVIVYSQYQSILEIDSNRQIILDR